VYLCLEDGNNPQVSWIIIKNCVVYVFLFNKRVELVQCNCISPPITPMCQSGPGHTRQFLCILRKNLSSFPWYQCAWWIFFPPNFVKHYQTSQATSSCFGAGQIFVRCENRTDFTICTAWSKEKVFKCAHDYQIENLAETNFVESFGPAKQILSVQCVWTLSQSVI